MEKFKVKLPDGDVFYVSGDRIISTTVAIEIAVDRATVAVFPIGTSIVKASAIADKD
ncbi:MULTISPECIES: hypothetical protein [Proteiniphilum]|jgi:hypothetical protein|uniref:hypothetical protein n=1 Tax=Proteiniphilum TaxID=294702 RepID=UPI001EEC70C6|nr:MULTISPECIES: hypothetical protein [Proteiniphilum]ULB33606.1 hypothetical protein KDN43_11370 [Proteiniphilum propionicum]